MLIRQAERLLITAQSPKVFAFTVVFFNAIHNVHVILPGSNVWLTNNAPWLLVSLSPATNNTVAAASVMTFWIFYMFGVPRRAIPKLLWYLAAKNEITVDEHQNSRLSARARKLTKKLVNWGESERWGARVYRWLGYIRVDVLWIYMMARRGVKLRWLAPWVLLMISLEIFGWYHAGQALRPHVNTLNTVVMALAVCYLLLLVAKWATAKTNLATLRQRSA